MPLKKYLTDSALDGDPQRQRYNAADLFSHRLSSSFTNGIFYWGTTSRAIAGKLSK